MRVVRITPDLNIVISETSQSPRVDASQTVPLFRGHPGRKVRVGRLLLELTARHSAAAPLAAAALWLCRQELAEMVLACDPDMVDVTGVYWGSHLRRALEPQFPYWFSDAKIEGASRSDGWRKFDPSAKVSIVLPVYKVRSYLQQSIESCLTQTYRNIELLVVDDGSADDVAAALRTYDDSRIHLLHHERNRGLAVALNTGFEAATGDFLTWTSDDNYYHPSAIGEMVSFLQTYRNIDFVYAEMHIIDERPGVHPPRVWDVKPPQWLWAREGNPVGACFLYWQRVFEELRGYDPSAFLVEDYEYWLRVAKRFRMQRLFKPLYYYRYHSDALTARYDRSQVVAKTREVRRQHGARV
jgi:hypothetical protein